MMDLQNSCVIVKDCKVTSRITQICTIPSRVINVVDNSTDQTNGFVDIIKKGLNTLFLKEVGGSLHHISCMAAKEKNHKSKDEDLIFFIQLTQLVSLDMEYYKFTLSYGTNWHCGSWLQLVSASSEEWTP